MRRARACAALLAPAAFVVAAEAAEVARVVTVAQKPAYAAPSPPSGAADRTRW